MKIIIEMIPIIGIVVLTVAYVTSAISTVKTNRKMREIFAEMEKENRAAKTPIKIGEKFLCPFCGEYIEAGIHHCDVCLKRLDWSDIE